MLGTWPLEVAIAAFAGLVLVTLAAGVRLSTTADVLADRSGWGEALFGSVLFGGVTSLSGIVITATAATADLPRMAYGNAVGGIAGQTAALAVADLFHRRANLEHAAASVPNLMSGLLLTALLALALLGSFTPAWTALAVHPTTLLVLVAWLYGMHLVREVRDAPLWRPHQTPETRLDEPDQDALPHRSTASLTVEFVLLGLLVGSVGWGLARAAGSIVAHTGLSASLVGAAMLGVANAIPEAVTAVAAVRRGALTLAVGVVLGGNAFDVLNLAVGDVAWRGGSLYHAAGSADLFLTGTALLMTVVVLAGLVRREQRGFANIGAESVLLLVLYATSLVVLTLA